MALTFTASIQNWSEKAIDHADLVVKQSVQDLGSEMINPKDGLVRGAPFETGVVPVDEGQLLASSFVAVGGGVSARGSTNSAPDFVAALAGLDTGETIVIGFSAPYAVPVEYGFRIGDDDTDDATGDVDVPGRFMVRLAVQQWATIVQRNAAKLKD